MYVSNHPLKRRTIFVFEKCQMLKEILLQTLGYRLLATNRVIKNDTNKDQNHLSADEVKH